MFSRQIAILTAIGILVLFMIIGTAMRTKDTHGFPNVLSWKSQRRTKAVLNKPLKQSKMMRLLLPTRRWPFQEHQC